MGLREPRSREALDRGGEKRPVARERSVHGGEPHTPVLRVPLGLLEHLPEQPIHAAVCAQHHYVTVVDGLHRPVITRQLGRSTRGGANFAELLFHVLG
jgi:hypothetical protein